MKAFIPWSYFWTLEYGFVIAKWGDNTRPVALFLLTAAAFVVVMTTLNIAGGWLKWIGTQPSSDSADWTKGE